MRFCNTQEWFDESCSLSVCQQLLVVEKLPLKLARLVEVQLFSYVLPGVILIHLQGVLNISGNLILQISQERETACEITEYLRLLSALMDFSTILLNLELQ